MNFYEKLEAAIQKNNSLLCIGLDTSLEKLPKHLQNHPHPIYSFNKEIIDETHDLVCGYKPNSAFYEAYGVDGIEQLQMTCDYIRKQYPELVIIIDAKRGDIGTTSEAYAQYIFDYLRADAVTLHPYLGREANQPFLDFPDKGCIILCRNSNPGAGEFQDLMVSLRAERSNPDAVAMSLYQHVAHQVSKEWNANRNCLLVVGATYPEELAQVRKIVGDMPILVPGIGAQGGDLQKTLQAGLTADKKGLIITVSRSIIYASEGTDFASKSRQEASNLREDINVLRAIQRT